MNKLICRKCRKEKTLDCFANNGNGYQYKDGKSRYKAVCRECLNAYTKQWRKDNPQKARRTDHSYRTQKKYGISRDQYEKLMERHQDGCALCGAKTANGKTQHLNVDHNHNTNAVRGLLCTRCNTVLGLVKEDMSLLSRMIQYLNGQDVRPLTAILDEAPKMAEERRPSIPAMV